MTSERAHGRLTRRSFVHRFSSTSVLVVGDVMLDEYVWGDVHRISPEAPVPVVRFHTRTVALGGAANAAANVASLGGHALLSGVVGRDIEANILREELAKTRIEAHLVATDDRLTTTKTRVIGGSQQILRIDREELREVSAEMESALLDWANRNVPSIGCVVISDYGKGVLTQTLCKGLIDLARAQHKPVIVDPKGRDYAKYKGATVVTPNVMELHLAVEALGPSSADLEEDVTTLRSLLTETSFLVTRGSEGVSLFPPDGQGTHISARERNVYDVTGAGDTFVATLALAIGAGAPLPEAASIANSAAGIVVGKLGTGTVELAELERQLG